MMGFRSRPLLEGTALALCHAFPVVACWTDMRDLLKGMHIYYIKGYTHGNVEQNELIVDIGTDCILAIIHAARRN